MRKKLPILFKSIWIVTIFIFAGIYFNTNWDKIKPALIAIDKLSLLLSIVFLVTAKFTLSITARIALIKLGIKIRFITVFNFYNLSQIAKYIPGSIWQYAGRIFYYKSYGLSSTIIRDAILSETIWVIGSSLIIGVSFTILTDPFRLYEILNSTVPTWKPLYTIASCLFLIFFFLLFNKRIKSIVSTLLSYNLPVKWYPTLFSIWLLLGISFWFLCYPYGVKINNILFTIGLYAIAFFAGFMVPFAPAGIGIREIVLLSGISPLVDFEEAVVLVSISRVLYVSVELILYLVSTFLIKDSLYKPPSPQESPIKPLSGL